MLRDDDAPEPPRYEPAVLFLAALALGACGSKTGLYAPDVETSSPPDAADVVNPADVVTIARCTAIRVHTRVGFVTSLRPNTDSAAATGYNWQLRHRPTGSTAMLFTNGSPVATITPDMQGDYDILVTVPARGADGNLLQCPILLIADPPDLDCPGYTLTEPQVVAIPGGDMQVGYDAVWLDTRSSQGGGVGGIFSDDPSARVAAVVMERPLRSAVTDPMLALGNEGLTAEHALTTSLNAVGVLVGQTGTTHEHLPIRRTTMRVTLTSPTTPDALRDQAVQAVGALGPPAQPAPAFAPATDFYVGIATIVRPDTRNVVFAITVSPSAAFDDPSMPTAIRVEDFANATPIAQLGAQLGVQCEAQTETRVGSADFLWFVDTTREMIPFQTRLGDAAQTFFRTLNAAGVDFRVGVIEAGNAAPTLEGSNGSGPFTWIQGDDPMGPSLLAWTVTIDDYPGEPSGAGSRQPFPTPETLDGDGHEEPMAQSILALRVFDQHRMRGDTNPNFVLRPNAVTAAFWVTLEGASDDDYEAYFRPNASMWGGTDPAALQSSISQWFMNRQTLLFGLVPLVTDFNGNPLPCPSIDNLAECVITATGGAFASIDAPSDAASAREIASEVERVAELVTGAASPFALPTIPISSSLRVKVNGTVTPRSRVDGFDYDERANAIVLRGPTFHPRMGDRLQAAYFIWVGP